MVSGVFNSPRNSTRDTEMTLGAQVDPEPAHSVVEGSSREMPLRRGSNGLVTGLVTVRSLRQQAKERHGLT